MTGVFTVTLLLTIITIGRMVLERPTTIAIAAPNLFVVRRVIFGKPTWIRQHHLLCLVDSINNLLSLTPCKYKIGLIAVIWILQRNNLSTECLTWP